MDSHHVLFVLWQGGKDSLRIQLAEMIMRVPPEDLQKTVASVMKDLWIRMEEGGWSWCISIYAYTHFHYTYLYISLFSIGIELYSQLVYLF